MTDFNKILEKAKEIESKVKESQEKIRNISDANLRRTIDLKEIEIIQNPINLAITNSMFNPSQFLVKTEICKKVGGCDERIRHSQEYSLTLRLSFLLR